MPPKTQTNPARRLFGRPAERQKGSTEMATPTETTTPETNSTTPATTAPAAPSDSGAKRPVFSLNTSKHLREALEAKAKAEDLPLAGLIRKAAYAYLGEPVEEGELTAGTKRKFANEAERKEATNARNEEVKALLELSKMARSKGLNLTDLLKQQLEAANANGTEQSAA